MTDWADEDVEMLDRCLLADWSCEERVCIATALREAEKRGYDRGRREMAKLMTDMEKAFAKGAGGDKELRR